MKSNRIKYGNVFFWTGMLLQLFYTGRIITINSYEKSAFYVLLIMMLFSASIGINRKYGKKEMRLFVLLVLCGIMHLFFTEDANLLRIITMVFACENIRGYTLKKYLAVIYPAFFSITVWLSLNTNFNPAYQENVWRIAKGWELRWTLGFDGPTRMMFVWVCIIVSVQIYTGKINKVRDMLFLLGSIFLYSISDSNTGIIISMMAIILPYILGFFVKRKITWILLYSARVSLLIVLGLTFFATMVDIESTHLGVFLNGRTGSLYWTFHSGYYPRLFGTEIPDGARGLDNSYYYCTYLLGIVPMLILIMLIWRLGTVYWKNKDVMGTAALITFIFLAYVTQTFEHPYLNYILFFAMENWRQVLSPIYDKPFVEKKKWKLSGCCARLRRIEQEYL